MAGTGFLFRRNFTIYTNVLRGLILILCVQLKENLVQSSVNSTINITQVSEKEDLGQSTNSLSSDVSLRRNLPRCGGIYTVRPEDLAFRIYSPDYPLPYPSLLNCIYDIRFKGGSFPCHLDIRFEDFYLSSEPPDCYGDRLEISGQRFCGGLLGIQRFETEWGRNGERHLLLRMVTDEVGTGRGFRICVSQVPCNGPLPVPPPFAPYPPPVQPPPILPAPPSPPSPPYYPPWIPPIIPPRPLPPSYFPPVLPPLGSNLPLCCGTQYQGHHIHLISPGFPAQLPGVTNCGYVINRLNPRVTQLRINFKYFFLPCPWEPYGSEGGSLYPRSVQGYFNVDNQNICGCQTGRMITIPFGVYETRKILRFSNLAINPLLRSQTDAGIASEIYNESSVSNAGKVQSQFRPAHDHDVIEKSENSHSVNEDTLRGFRAFRGHLSPDFDNSHLVLFPSTSHTTSSVVDTTGNQRLTKENIDSVEENSTSIAVRKSKRAFNSYLNYRPSLGPPLGFLLEVVQEEIPYYSGWRRNAFKQGSNTESISEKLKTFSPSSVQNAASRFFHLHSRSCRVSDWPQVKWWLIWLHKKHLLQVCPARVPPFLPPFNPPFCNEPFIPISR